MNFIQLTDLHIGQNQEGEELENLEKIIVDIIERYPPNICPLIIITGDFVHHGTQVEYDKVVLELQKLIDIGYRMLVCPGNHDFGQGTPGNWNKYQPEARERYLDNIHNRLLNIDHDKKDFWKTNTIFPVTTVFDKVLFVGLDTMHGVLEEKVHFATGKVNYDQIVDAVSVLTNPQYAQHTKIVYMHHSLYSARPTMYLKYREKLTEELMHAGVHMVCFGHTHNFEMFDSSGLIQSMKAVCGRKVTDRFRPNDGLKNSLEYYYYTVGVGKVGMTPIHFQ